MLTQSDIKRLIDGGETSAVEFKLAKGGVPASLWESYSAFANTDGGVIVLGVGETGGRRHVVGVADADKMVADIWNAANNPQRVSANDFWNYHGRQGIVIEKRFNRLMFRNPGCLRMSRDATIAGGRSDARNSRIFNIFALIDIGERSGTGLSDIFSTWKECGYEKPTITETYQPDQLSVVVFVETEVAGSTTQEQTSATQETNGVATETGGVAAKTDSFAPKTESFVPKNSDVAPKTGDVAPKTGDVAPKPAVVAPKTSDVAPKTGDVAVTMAYDVVDKKLRVTLGEVLKVKRLAAREAIFEKCTFVYFAMKEETQISRRALAVKLKLPPRSISRYQALLVQAGLLAHTGPKNGGEWKFSV